jgi:hypothetical protein
MIIITLSTLCRKCLQNGHVALDETKKIIKPADKLDNKMPNIITLHKKKETKTENKKKEERK